VARAILYRKNKNALQTKLEEAKDEIKQLELWRKQGPIGKLHNIIVYILTSSQREQQFEEFQRIFGTSMPSAIKGSTTQTSWKLILNIDTRWNSTYDMIDRAIHLISAINAFIKKEERE
jgi:hypothetical protein